MPEVTRSAPMSSPLPTRSNSLTHFLVGQILSTIPSRLTHLKPSPIHSLLSGSRLPWTSPIHSFLLVSRPRWILSDHSDHPILPFNLRLLVMEGDQPLIFPPPPRRT